MANEPWWIESDRENLARLERLCEGKLGSDMVRPFGDSTPETVTNVRKRITKLADRIESDIARFNKVNGDYDRM